jgi:Ca2+-binding RTX toxin-like protein
MPLWNPRTLALPVALLAICLPAAANTIEGTDDRDWIGPNFDPPTTDGDDTITALGGDDDIRPGAGNDTVDAGLGDDNVLGGDGDDTLDGGRGEDTVNGENGNDTLQGGPGDDELRGGGSADRGNDLIQGGDGNDELYGGWGEDTLAGDAGEDEIWGGPDADAIDGGGGDDVIHGEDGNDIIGGGEGDDTIRAGDDDDQAYGGPGEDDVFGGGGSDYLDGEEGLDRLDGETGQDAVIGRHPGERLVGGPGNDVIVIVGASIDDYEVYDGVDYADDGSIREFSDNGDDMIIFVHDVNPDQMTYEDAVIGSNTYRHLEFNPGLVTDEPVTLDLASSDALGHFEAVTTGTGNDTVHGTDRDDNNTYQQRFTGGESPAPWLNVAELFFTGAGDDTIHTRGGSDLVDAGTGNDTIVAGPGDHFITTGDGADTIAFVADEFDGQGNANLFVGPRCRIADLDTVDRILIANARVDGFELTEDSGNGIIVTRVAYGNDDDNEQFDLFGVTPEQVHLRNVDGGVQLTVSRPGIEDDPREPNREPEIDQAPGRGNGPTAPTPRPR